MRDQRRHSTVKLAITNGTIIDGTGAPPGPGAVIVTDDRISAILPGDGALPSVDRTIDAGGGTILPGLIDAHDHQSYHNTFGLLQWQWTLPRDQLIIRSCIAAFDALRHGVTTIREMGATGATNFSIKKAIADGDLIGPRMVTCGMPITITGGYAYWICTEADGPDGVRTAARLQLKNGADFIKLMASNERPRAGHEEQSIGQFTVDELRAGVDEAHAAGVKVAVHACSSKAIERCLDAGVDTIEHGVYLNRELAQRMKEQGTYYSPTLGIYEFDTDLFWRRGKAKAEFCKLLTRAHRKNFEKFFDLELKWTVGTDAIVPIATEMQKLVDAGLDPMTVILSATRTNAELIGRLDDLGTLEAGKLADIVIVDGNPLKKMSHMANVKVIIQGGKSYYPDQLLPMLPSMAPPS
jgi:imidazolonepropionase-like amidohydrolase